MKGFRLLLSRVGSPVCLALLAVLFLSLSGSVAEADDCLYLVFDDCFDLDETISIVVLERYFVIEYDGDCTRIYDVLIRANQPNLFAQVMDPIRSHDPNLRDYNNYQVFFPKALGEIKETELQQAISDGTVVEMSRLLLDERCGWPQIPPEPKPERCDIVPTPPDPPWQITQLESELMIYAYLHELEDGCPSPQHPDLALPEGTYATFLLVDKAQIDEVMDLLSVE
ncbi:MAG: hypothetical protein L0332_04935 [Chloroflexi bacterium]|nr:hypothetical protein [Chloroflexota bacterium]MCI0580367.1 hypothetical protein [Chloroflexota bacterium]MCI0649521.1 hypothetical protein [Chloroflexota bacterium]MCI0726052.1 hypothetical protein [Chloroflexota bacterium]